MTEFVVSLLYSTLRTILLYFPAWIFGTVVGLLVSYIVWSFSPRYAWWSYLALTAVSFVPVTILLPYAIRAFGLRLFAFPLLAWPVLLITFSSSYEAFRHANRHRLTLLKNYNMAKAPFFWRVVFRESMPSMTTTARQTVALCFAIFLALDYFMEYWQGLGRLVHHYYDLAAFDPTNQWRIVITIAFTGCIGALQVFVIDRIFRRWTELRRPY